MRTSTSTSVLPVRLQALALMVALCLVVGSAVAAGTGPTYSNVGPGSVTNFTPYKANGIFPDEGVRFPERAGDADLQNFAILNTAIGVLNFQTIRMALGGVGGVKGDRAGVLVSNVVTSNNLLNLNALGVLRLVTYNGAVKMQTVVVSAAVAKSLLESNGSPTQLEFLANTPFTAIELQVGGVATVSYKLNVHYAYSVPALVQKPARGLISRFTGGTPSSKYDTSVTPQGPATVCVNSEVINPENTVDNNLDNYALFSSTATVNCPTAIKVKLEGQEAARAGYYAGFVIGSEQLLDLSVLSALRLTTYLDGVKQETAVDPRLLEIKLLPDGKSQVSFPTTKAFNEVRIERVGLLSVLDDLRIYYGFAVEPRALAGNPQVLSDFPASNTTRQYETESKVGLVGVAGVCVGCSISNPEFATDANPSNYATMNMGLASVNYQMSLKMNLNGVGVVGNRAGVTISNGGNLIDVDALKQITVTTLDAAGNVLESASGASLLAVNVLPDGKQEISFLTTRDFSSVKLTLSSGASAFDNIRVFNAFADDRTGDLPTIIGPLPVELSAFTGRWAYGAAALSWTTASEKNSSHFVVERSTGRDVGFQAIGQVQSVGNSSSPHTYTLRDEEAVSQGVAVLYYRLRQVDVDGKQAFSPVVSVVVNQRSSASRLEVYPNPTSDVRSVMIRLQDLPAGSTVLTYAPLGQLVSEMPAVTSEAIHLVLPATLAPGMYHVVLRSANGKTLATQRLVVEGR